MAAKHQEPRLHEIRATPYGGRGVFAVTDIPKEALILSCSAPYASVILRKFRKEVCNWCYAYSFEKGKNKWDFKLGDSKTTPIYFCSEDCLKTWVQDYQGSGSIAVWTQLCSSLEKTYLQETAWLSTSKQSPKITPKAEALVSRLENLTSSEVSNEVVTDLWALAEEVFTVPKTILPTLRHWGMELKAFLTEFELDAARFILDGLFRRALEDVAVPDVPVKNMDGLCITGLGLWQDLLKLQDTEIHTIRTHPEMLASFIRVYGLLKHIIGSTKSSPNSALLEALRSHVLSPRETRAFVARDHSNAFGIWEQAGNDGESEMLGWGMFISASFFNHGMFPTFLTHLNPLTLFAHRLLPKYKETRCRPGSRALHHSRCETG
jgi:hypothetical protein